MTTNQVDGISLQQLAEPQQPYEIIQEALEKHNLDSLYVLYSGGKDSNCVSHFVRKNFPKYFKGNVYTNVGLGSIATRKFVIDYCHKNNIPLFMTWNVDDKRSFTNLVLQHGFATKGSHRIWMGYLKFQSWYYFMRDYVRAVKGENAAFISGVRKVESKQRKDIKKCTRNPVDKNATLVFIKPFLYKNGNQLWDYFIENKLEKTPTYEWLNRSGECYCGAYTEPWDLQMIKTRDTLAYNTIAWLTEQIKLRGTEEAKRNSMWGEVKNSIEGINSQMTFDSFVADGQAIKINDDYCGESCFIN